MITYTIKLLFIVTVSFSLSIPHASNHKEPAGRWLSPPVHLGIMTDANPDPCALLSDELLSEFFDIGEAPITRSPSKYSPHPLCIATWPKPNAEKIEQENTANMADYMRAKLSGDDETARKLKKRSTVEVSLTIDQSTHDTEEKAASAFERAMRITREGMEVDVKGEKTKTPTYQTTEIEEIGSRAMWLERMNQLSVLSGKKIFHVGVIIEQDSPENLEKAKAIARELSKKIR